LAAAVLEENKMAAAAVLAAILQEVILIWLLVPTHSLLALAVHHREPVVQETMVVAPQVLDSLWLAVVAAAMTQEAQGKPVKQAHPVVVLLIPLMQEAQ
jgi:hypothetical protein